MSYTTLTAAKTTSGSIKNYVSRSDIPVTSILTEAEAFIYQRLRVREMMTTEDVSIASGIYKGALPSGFLDPIKLTPYGWGDPLDYVTEDRFQHQREVTTGTRITADTPSCWTVIGTDIWFDIQLTATFGGMLIYYKTPTALSGANETNFLTSRYPTLLRHACMHFAYEHMKDPARSLEMRKVAEAEIAEAAATNELYRHGQF